MRIDFTLEELRELDKLIVGADGRMPRAFYSAADKIGAILHPEPVSWRCLTCNYSRPPGESVPDRCPSCRSPRSSFVGDAV